MRALLVQNCKEMVVWSVWMLYCWVYYYSVEPSIGRVYYVTSRHIPWYVQAGRTFKQDTKSSSRQELPQASDYVASWRQPGVIRALGRDPAPPPCLRLPITDHHFPFPLVRPKLWPVWNAIPWNIGCALAQSIILVVQILNVDEEDVLPGEVPSWTPNGFKREWFTRLQYLSRSPYEVTLLRLVNRWGWSGDGWSFR